jgi:hypothetical protein
LRTRRYRSWASSTGLRPSGRGIDTGSPENARRPVSMRMLIMMMRKRRRMMMLLLLLLLLMMMMMMMMIVVIRSAYPSRSQRL